MCLRTALIAVALSIPATLAGQTEKPQIIRDVRVFDGEHVQEHRSVLIAGGKIARVGDAGLKAPAGAEVINGKGRTLLPGLIDAHVHLPDNAEDAMRQALACGVTTQLDMFSAGDRLKKIKALEAEDRTGLAAVRTAGTGVTVAGGHPTEMGGPAIPHCRGLRLHQDHS
jgi:imidazolonepropionase-like amidohydrolase